MGFVNGVEAAAVDTYPHDSLCFSRNVQILLNNGKCVVLGLLQLVVDHDAVELRGKGELKLGTGDALVDNLGGIGSTAFQAAAQLVDSSSTDGGWINRLSASSP